MVDALWNNDDSIAHRFLAAAKPHISRESAAYVRDELEKKIEGTSKGRRELRQKVRRAAVTWSLTIFFCTQFFFHDLPVIIFIVVNHV